MRSFNQIIGLVTLTVLSISSQSWAGGAASGGGFYGRDSKGQWVLLDFLEEGKELTMSQKKSPEMMRFLDEVGSRIPELRRQFEKIFEKTWREVPYSIQCEAPQSPLNVQMSAGACQDKNDIFIDKRFNNFNTAVHELVQGARLQINTDSYGARKMRGDFNPPPDAITPADVRALTRTLLTKPMPSAQEILVVLKKYDFGEWHEYYSKEREVSTLAAIRDVQNDFYEFICLDNQHLAGVKWPEFQKAGWNASRAAEDKFYTWNNGQPIPSRLAEEHKTLSNYFSDTLSRPPLDPFYKEYCAELKEKLKR